LSAPTRLTAASLWQRATEIRREWLELGLSTEPADRATAEQAITTLYARHGRPRPRFDWTLSPHAALPLLAGLPTHDELRSWVADRRPPGRPPLASDIAAGLSRLRSDMADAFTEPPPDRPAPKRKKGESWPVLPPAEALTRGLPLAELLRQGIRESLTRSLADGLYLRVRAALGPTPVAWYGNQDAAWLGHLDAHARLGLGPSPAAFQTWLTLARSAGWWWPGEDRCVMVERPAVLKTEPVPGAWHDEVRLAGPIVYPDGWSPS
jgi:hypothetical protein